MTVEYDSLRGRAAPWVEPIAGAAPAGVAARFDPEYQSLANEVGKLDAPTGGDVDWKSVVRGAGTLLEKRTKDLVVAAYLSHALHRTQGLAGLTTGLVLLSETIERYWDTMFPELKRPRGRANALQWFVEKTNVALAKASPGASEELDGLEAAAKRLSALAREKLAELCPAFGPLLDPVERLRAAASPPPPAPTAPAVSAAPAPAPAATVPAAAPAASPPPPVAAVAAPLGLVAGASAPDFLRNVGASLVTTAAALRKADGADPLAYRIVRTGLWLHLEKAPPATGGKTQIPAPPASLRSQLATLESNARWPALLEETESASGQHRFWLDLHRLSAQALSALGPAHVRAKDAVVAELGALLARMPELPTLAFADGTPLADPRTRGWIDEEVRASAGGAERKGAAAAGGGETAVASAFAEGKKLLAAGKAAEALAFLRDEATRARSGRERFLRRAETARLCAGAGLTAIAKALYEELDRELVLHRLEEWEPALAAECLKGLLAAARALAKDPRGSLPDPTEPYKRLCRIDPAAAHEVWP